MHYIPPWRSPLVMVISSRSIKIVSKYLISKLYGCLEVITSPWWMNTLCRVWLLFDQNSFDKGCVQWSLFHHWFRPRRGGLGVGGKANHHPQFHNHCHCHCHYDCNINIRFEEEQFSGNAQGSIHNIRCGESCTYNTRIGWEEKNQIKFDFLSQFSRKPIFPSLVFPWSGSPPWLWRDLGAGRGQE